MIDERTTLTINGGTDVFGADGGKVGSVSGVEQDYMIVSKGFFFPTDYYIPLSAINTANDDGVYLDVTKDAALHQGWDSAPTTADGTYGTDRAYTDRELTDRATNGAYDPSRTWPDQDAHAAGDQKDSLVDKVKDTFTGDDTRQADGETVRVPLSEEELVAEKHPVDRGGVQVEKVVTERQETLDVPVSEEHVSVSRRAVDRDLQPGETLFEEGTIEVPIRGEEVAAGKQPRVREELEITKNRVDETRQVSGTVRREEARVREGDEVIDETAATANGKPRRKARKR